MSDSSGHIWNHYIYMRFNETGIPNTQLYKLLVPLTCLYALWPWLRLDLVMSGLVNIPDVFINRPTRIAGVVLQMWGIGLIKVKLIALRVVYSFTSRHISFSFFSLFVWSFFHLYVLLWLIVANKDPRGTAVLHHARNVSWCRFITQQGTLNNTRHV